MSATSSIEWTDKTWNPVRGCSIVSPGCKNCYAMKQAHRFSGRIRSQRVPRVHRDGPYAGLTKLTKAGPQWTGVVRTVEDALLEPLSWRKPARIFVNSMSDLFHEDVPDQFIIDVFGIMALAHQHTFQVLTKRPERMRAFLQAGDHGVIDQFKAIQQRGGVAPKGVFTALDIKRRDGVDWQWPLPNVWLGVSVENQKYADERIPLLLQTPAAVRFVSAEPLLGPIDLGQTSATCACCARFSSRWIELHRPVTPDFPLALLPEHRSRWRDAGITRAASNGHGALSVYTPSGLLGVRPSEFDALPALDWVIVGGESGAGARMCSQQWIRSIVQQCKAAGVPVFVKQIGKMSCFGEPGVNGGFRPADRKGGDMAEWPDDLRVRKFPKVAE